MAAKKPAKEPVAPAAAGDRFVTRREVRDGIIVSQEISFDPNSEMLSLADLKGAVEELFPSAEKRVRDLAEYAQREIDCGATGSRKQYAEHAVQVAEHVVSAMKKRKAESAVILAIAMMQSIWRVQIKAIEPTVVTGARAKQQRSRSGFSSGLERAAERKPEWDRWQSAFDRYRQENPALSKSRIHEMVAADFKVSRQAVAKRVS